MQLFVLHLVFASLELFFIVMNWIRSLIYKSILIRQSIVGVFASYLAKLYCLKSYSNLLSLNKFLS